MRPRSLDTDACSQPVCRAADRQGLRRSILRIDHFTPNCRVQSCRRTQKTNTELSGNQVWHHHRRHLVLSDTELEVTAFTWFQQEPDLNRPQQRFILTFWDLFWSEKNYQEVNKLTSSHLIHILPPVLLRPPPSSSILPRPPPSSPSLLWRPLHLLEMAKHVCVPWVDISWKTNRRPL